MSDLCWLLECALVGLFRLRAALEAEILLLCNFVADRHGYTIEAYERCMLDRVQGH